MDKVRIEVEIERDLLDEAERLGVDVQAEAERGLRRRLGRPPGLTAAEREEIARGVVISDRLSRNVGRGGPMTQAEADRWQRDNAEAIAFNNNEIERNGLWCDRYRLF